MKELSVTVTAGEGSEIHNHDLDYRSTLQHVHEMKNGIIELVPYKDYRERINELMKPYIDKYNEQQQNRYKAAWDRYNSGQIKTKPRKRDYKPMGYDYYEDHKDDVFHNQKTGKQEQIPMFRSLIIGIGDKADRDEGRITEQQARNIMAAVVEKFKEDFPDFKILGATIHLDEQGFYHMHLDFKPMFDRDIGQGLNVGIGLESALEHMGYEPEQSIINGRDKIPLLFNAMRNKVYYDVEAAMAEEELRMQYRASEVKEPGKDSSKNQRLEDWQATQDAARTIQHAKNVALDVIMKDEVSPEEYKTAVRAIDQMGQILEDVETSPRTIMRKGYKVSFYLFDQLKSALNAFKNTFQSLIQEISILRDNNDYYQAEFEKYKDKSDELQEQHDYILKDRNEQARIAENLQAENRRLRAFLQRKNLQDEYRKDQERLKRPGIDR